MGFRHRRSPAHRTRPRAHRQLSEPRWAICATLKGTNHSGFLPTATNTNCELYCERRTELKAVIRTVRPHMLRHFLPHRRRSTGLHLQTFDALMSPSCSVVWRRRVFISFPKPDEYLKWRHFVRTTKPSQQLGCGSVIKMHSCVVMGL